MAGHSHSANIRFRKDRVDAKRAKIFSKMARNITVAAKTGGGDPDANPRLRLAIDKARIGNMPKENIERAIKRGAGGGDQGAYEEICYEGYGPAGIAVMLEILTDNRHRTAPEIRKIFERAGGNLAASGSVAYLFQRKAVLVVQPDAKLSEERLLEIALEAGAEDLVRIGDTFAIHGAPGDFMPIKEALERAGVALEAAEVMQVPDTTVQVGQIDEARRLLGLLDELEDHDDVQTVAANYEMPDEIAEQARSRQ
jgi:YebC/PmpR family DNA-binding regulatory protein